MSIIFSIFIKNMAFVIKVLSVANNKADKGESKHLDLTTERLGERTKSVKKESESRSQKVKQDR